MGTDTAGINNSKGSSRRKARRGSGSGSRSSREGLLRDMPIGKALLILGIPSVLSMVVEGVNMAVDKFYLGKLGAVEVAASNIFGIFFMLGFGLVSIFMFGSSSYFTYVLGTSKVRAAAARLNGILLMVVFSILYSLLMFVLFKPAMVLFAPDVALYNATQSYTYIMLAGLPVIYLFIGMSMFVKGEGAVNVVTLSLVASVVLNIILTPIMMFGFDWGIMGAALGTVLSHLIAILVMVAFLLSGKSIVELRAKLSLNRRFMVESFQRGFPEFSGGLLEGVVIAVGLIMAATYNNALIASYGLFLSIIILPMFIIWGFAHAVRILLSYNLGVNNKVRVRRVIRLSATLTGFIGVTIFLIFMLFPYQIVEFFIVDAEVVDIVGKALRISSFMFITMAFIDFYINYLAARGRGVLGGTIQMVKIFVQIPLLFIALEFLPPIWLLLVTPIAEFVYVSIGFMVMLAEKTFLQYLFGKKE